MIAIVGFLLAGLALGFIIGYFTHKYILGRVKVNITATTIIGKGAPIFESRGECDVRIDCDRMEVSNKDVFIGRSDI